MRGVRSRARCGKVWKGAVRCGKVQQGVVRCGKVWPGAARCCHGPVLSVFVKPSWSPTVFERVLTGALEAAAKPLEEQTAKERGKEIWGKTRSVVSAFSLSAGSLKEAALDESEREGSSSDEDEPEPQKTPWWSRSETPPSSTGKKHPPTR